MWTLRWLAFLILMMLLVLYDILDLAELFGQKAH
jgi:hypothetical protein